MGNECGGQNCGGCDLHVSCDLKCGALEDPGESVSELQQALEHWINHPRLAGCSHGQ